MWLDAVALAVLAFFVLVGAARGALASGASLAALGAACGAAIAAAPRLGPPLAARLGLPEILGPPLAGALVFLGVGLAAGALSMLVRRSEGRRRLGGRSPWDRLLGALFGGARGVLAVLLLGWIALWIDALHATGIGRALPELGSSAASAATEPGVEAAAEVVLSDPVSTRRAVASAVARPRRTLAGLQAVLEHPLVEDLRRDGLFWTYVGHGSVDAALHRSSFIRISRDEGLRRKLARVGWVEPAAAASPGAFRDAIDPVLRRFGARIRGLHADPETRELLEDPGLLAMLRSGDARGLIENSGFRQLLARVTAPPE